MHIQHVSVCDAFTVKDFFFPCVVDGLKAVKNSHVNPEEKVQILNWRQWWLLHVTVWIIPAEALCGMGKGGVCGNTRPHSEIKSWDFVLPVP